jgi:hypothetical protein
MGAEGRHDLGDETQQALLEIAGQQEGGIEPVAEIIERLAKDRLKQRLLAKAMSSTEAAS